MTLSGNFAPAVKQFEKPVEVPAQSPAMILVGRCSIVETDVGAGITAHAL
jgi:hypothetical protein